MPDVNTGAEGVVETQTQDTPAADTAVVAEPAAPEWDGDWSKVGEQPWYKSLPDTARTHLDKRLADADQASKRAEFLDRMFQADDSVAALMKELEASKAERGTLAKALDTAKFEHTKLTETYTSAQQRLAEMEADRAFDAMAAKYPDIFKDVYYKDAEKSELEDKGAYMKFIALLEKGLPEEDAAKYARLELPQGAQAASAPATPPRPAERTVEVPKSVRAASIPGNSASTTVPAIKPDEDIDKALASAKAKAALEDGVR